jgi:Flp pilus assembly protein TadD
MPKPKKGGKSAGGRQVKRNVAADRSPALSADVWICVLLAIAVFVAYSQALHFDFVTYDDPDYGSGNPHVRAGLTIAGIAWAFSSSYAGNWFPLTWISHMLDWQLFGSDSGWHHFTNMWIHALSTVLWFVVLKRMTGARWRSALVAFLFALHPLHVESVAWIAERKDVLSGLFCVLTLWSYADYAARPRIARYVLTLFLFCLGLMAKPMLVTLPFLLLLLDRWPLQRGTKIVEKTPFFLASAAVSVVTWLVHRGAGATASFDLVPPVVRFENALVACAVYILKTLWPADLAVFYPYSLESPLVPAVIAGIALAAITAFAIYELPRRPYLAVGWLWYLVTLVPVIGLIQVGAQARADRYTYIPMVGLSIAVVWGVSEAFDRWPGVRTGLAAVVCLACLTLTLVQVQYWRDSIALYRHAISAVPDSYVARFNLASVLEARGEPAEAVTQLRETVRTRPGFALAHSALGQLLAKQNQPEEGLRELQTAVRLRPDLTDAHLGLATVLGALGRGDDAVAEFSQVIRLQPENADAHFNFGIALAQKGNLPDAEREFSATVRLVPDDADAHYNLGVTLARLNRIDEAIPQLSEAVRLKPDFNEARGVLEDLHRMKGK